MSEIARAGLLRARLAHSVSEPSAIVLDEEHGASDTVLASLPQSSVAIG